MTFFVFEVCWKANVFRIWFPASNAEYDIEAVLVTAELVGSSARISCSKLSLFAEEHYFVRYNVQYQEKVIPISNHVHFIKTFLHCTLAYISKTAYGKLPLRRIATRKFATLIEKNCPPEKSHG